MKRIQNQTTIKTLFLVATTLTLTTCRAVPLTAPNNATMTIQANPLSIPAVGGTSTITVTAFKASSDGGGTVTNGTQIFFTTDLGVIVERVATTNGIARATLQSDGRAGQATVVASSGTLEAQTVTVEIGAGDAGELVITVVANPSLLGPFDFTSEIVATVTDNRGNLLPGVPVIFSTDAGAMTSQGAVLRTNASGQSFDRLTLTDDGTETATVTVTSGSTTGAVVVSRAVFDDPIIDFVSPSTGSKGAGLTVTIGGQNFQAGATVSFGAGISVEQITFVNSETLLADIAINAGAATGDRSVIVTNPDGGSGESLADAFRVNGSAPRCQASFFEIVGGSGTQGDPFIMADTIVDFDATGSSDPDGSIASYDWNTGDIPAATSSQPAFTHDYLVGGIHQVVLTVEDNDGETCTITRFIDTP